jgi:hypothetical protein
LLLPSEDRCADAVSKSEAQNPKFEPIAPGADQMIKTSRFQRMLVKNRFGMQEEQPFYAGQSGGGVHLHRPSLRGSFEAKTGVGLCNFTGAIAAAAINGDRFVRPLLAKQSFESRRKRLFLVIGGNDHGNH